MWTGSLHPEKGNRNVKEGDSPQGKGRRVMVQPDEMRCKQVGTARKNGGVAAGHGGRGSVRRDAINSQSDRRV